MRKDNLRDGRARNWFYLENDLLDREDLSIYEKTVYIVIARYVNGENKGTLFISLAKAYAGKNNIDLNFK